MHTAIVGLLQAPITVAAADTPAQWLPDWRDRVATGADLTTLALRVSPALPGVVVNGQPRPAWCPGCRAPSWR